MDDMKNRPLVRGDELEEVEQAPGVFRKVAAHGDKAMVCQIRLVKGAVVQSHSHPHVQITCVISGRVRATAYGKTMEAGPGDTIYFAENEPHAVEALEETRVYDVFSPMREDFIQ